MIKVYVEITYQHPGTGECIREYKDIAIDVPELEQLLKERMTKNLGEERRVVSVSVLEG